LKQLARIEEIVVSDPEIMPGTPIFRGTRIPVDLVANMLVQGATVEETLEAAVPARGKCTWPEVLPIPFKGKAVHCPRLLTCRRRTHPRGT
jgi:hypothetical protein